jgi:hypothetical protein
VIHLRPPITAYSSHHLLVPASSQCLHHREERERGVETPRDSTRARRWPQSCRERGKEREREKVLSKQTPFLTAPPNPNPAVDEQKGSQLDDTNNSST